MKPLVTVVIPTYNSEKTIRRTIESVLDQSFNGWELIVIDDFSGDKTVEIVKEYQAKDSRIKLILNNFNWGGPAKPRNQGITAARGEFIAFLDADDWWYANKLEVCIPFLKTYDVVYHHLHLYTGLETVSGKIRGRKLTRPVVSNLLTNLNSIPNSSAIVRKNVLETVGLISEDKALIAVEDLDLWARIAMISQKFMFVNKILGAYWFGGGNITELSERQIQRLKTLYERHIDKLSKKDQIEAYYILEYYFGRIREKMGQKKIALKHFKNSIKRKNLEIKLKSLYLLIILTSKMLLGK